ncbi:MAG: hypothetical protein ACI9F9_001757, partial [Candidatus Paceibacteria bacterium]
MQLFWYNGSMRIWLYGIVLTLCASLASAAQEVISGTTKNLTFTAEQLTLEFEFQCESASAMIIWTQSDEIEVTQSIRCKDEDVQSDTRCQALGMPALMQGQSRESAMWSIRLQAETPGTASFRLSAVARSAQAALTVEAALKGNQHVRDLGGSGERVQAREALTRSLDSFLEACAVRLTREQSRALDKLAERCLELDDQGLARRALEAQLRHFEEVLPSRAYDLADLRWALAHTYTRLREFDLQREQLEQVESVLAVHGKRGAGTRRAARAELVKLHSRLGAYVLAEDLAEGFMRDYEDSVPYSDKALMDVKWTQAILREQQKDFFGAKLIMESLVEDLLDAYPARHMNVLRARAQMTHYQARTGDRSGTLMEQERLLGELESLSEIKDPERLRQLQIYERDLRALATDMRLNIAITWGGMGLTRKSHDLLEQVVAERQRTMADGDPRLINARRLLSDTKSKLEDFQVAYELARHSLEELSRKLPASHPRVLEARYSVMHSLMGIGRVDELMIHARALAEGSRTRLRQALTWSPRERASLARDMARELKILLVIADASYDPTLVDQLFVLIEEVRKSTATSTRDLRVPEQDSLILRQLGDEVRASHKRLGDLVAGLESEDESADPVELGPAIESRDAAEREYYSELAKQGHGHLKDVTPKEIGAALPEGSCAVSYWRTGDSDLRLRAPGQSGEAGDYFALILWLDGSIAPVRLGDAEVVLSAFRDWRAALGKPFPGDTRRPSASWLQTTGIRLRMLLLDPVVSMTGEFTKLYVTLDDELHLIPLDSLPLDGGLVGDQYTIRPLNFLSILAQDKQPAPRGKGLVAVGHVAYEPLLDEARVPGSTSRQSDLFDRSFDPLPQTEGEVRQLAELFESTHGGEATLLLGEAATKEEFLRVAPLARFLHLATHGGAAIGERMSTTQEASADRELIEGMAPLSLCGVALARANFMGAARG